MIRWFELAAAQGLADAQLQLGIMYELGQGVSQDNVKAYMWFRLSLYKGNKYSQKYIDEISKDMTHKQIVLAQLLANECN